MYNDDFLGALHRRLTKALPNWSLSPEADLSLLTISENATFRVRDPGTARDMILRVHRPEYHTIDEIRSELAWIEELRQRSDILTPAPIPGKDGELLYPLPDGPPEQSVVAFEFVAGKAPEEDDDLPAWFRELGAISARLHLQARSWPKPPSFARKLWNFDTTIGTTPHWGKWTEGLGLDASGRKLIGRTVAEIERRVADYGYGSERFGLLHADLRLANLLVDGDKLQIIDFDDCGFSWFVYDFAAAVSFIEHSPVVPALLESWVAGYRAVTDLSPEDEAMIPIFVMLRRIMLVAWIASHAETPTAQATGVPYTLGSLDLAERFLSNYG